MKYPLRIKQTISQVFLILFFSGLFLPVKSQLSQQVFEDNTTLSPEKNGELSIEIDNVTFFKNNEYDGDIMKGYTLPGFWLNTKATYQPLTNIKLEAGVHTLYYYGTKRYPTYAYRDIAKWNPDSYQSGVRILPFFRAHIALSAHFDLILGNIYGGANHHLIEPLYNPELCLTADPESGAQILYKSRFFDADMWVNWESFIFRDDTHQEAFTFGLSSRIKYNNPQSKVHFYTPIQLLAQHRGGEIDTIQTSSVHTLMNAAIGVGVEWNTNYRILKKITAEVNGMGYYQQAGNLWPLDDGAAWHASLAAHLSNFRIKMGYWKGNDFISLFGIPYYGAVSTVDETHVYVDRSTLYAGVEYNYTFGKGYTLGVDVDYYKPKATDVSLTTAFSAGVYLRINPSFLLKKY